MQIGVIIPIIQDVFINGLLNNIKNNTVQPAKIIIVDNSRNNIILSTKKMRSSIKVFRPNIPLGVNASWNYGIHELVQDVDLVSVLNDDLLIENYFFEKLTKLVSLHKDAAVFCPETVETPEMMLKTPALGLEKRDVMYRREGWAWTIRSSVAVKIPPIPEKLKTWFGDDWYWTHCQRLKQPWIKMLNNWCYHYVGQSNKIVKAHSTLKAERELFKALT